MTPVHCHLWREQSPSDEELVFDVVRHLEDSSELTRVLLRCRRCGQLYLYECHWHADPPARQSAERRFETYIPVDGAEVERMTESAPLDLLFHEPRLQIDRGSQPRWIGTKQSSP